MGENGYSWSGDINDDLTSRIDRMNKRNKTINFIRLFDIDNSAYGYFISDDEGTEWTKNLGTHLSDELDNGKKSHFGHGSSVGWKLGRNKTESLFVEHRCISNFKGKASLLL